MPQHFGVNVWQQPTVSFDFNNGSVYWGGWENGSTHRQSIYAHPKYLEFVYSFGAVKVHLSGLLVAGKARVGSGDPGIVQGSPKLTQLSGFSDYILHIALLCIMCSI